LEKKIINVKLQLDTLREKLNDFRNLDDPKTLFKEITDAIHAEQNTFKELKFEIDEYVQEHPGSTSRMILISRHQHIVKKTEEIFSEFLDLQKEFEIRRKQRIERLALAIDDTLNKEDIEMLQNHASPEKLLTQMTLDTSDIVLQQIRDIEKRNETAKLIQANMHQLAQDWKTFQLLVTLQSEKIESILENIEQTKHYVEKAEDELKKSEKYQASSQKYTMCCVAVLLIVFVIIGVMFLK
jgi:t-SNARE complex subunit (syntaxin)